MNFKLLVSLSLLLTTLNVFPQDISLSALLINSELKENANAVIRSHDIVVELDNYASMTVKEKRIITVLNKNGMSHLDPYVNYDPSVKVKSISAKVYDAMGSEIKKIRRKDFKDYSNNDSGLFSDNRILALDYTPISFPFTFEFEVETHTNSTAFIPRWFPSEGYFISTQKSSFKIINNQNVSLDIKEFNLIDEKIESKNAGNITHYIAQNLKAYKWEYMSPSFNKFAPVVMVAPKRFRLIDVDGHAENWNDFGKWNFDNLLTGRNDLPESAKKQISNLVVGVDDPMEKARIIYNYVQNKTRYISVQLGVGGWQPILASQVDEVSYGDCKALTNYTKALMESQGIEAYYTVVYGGKSVRDIEKDFVGMQGNHVILNLPNEGNPIWLECTSQKVPFGHIANFTDDRDVLVVTPEGGRIEHTKVYDSKESYLKTSAQVTFNEKGGFNAEISINSGGIQYDDRLSYIVDSDQKDIDKFYKEYWDHINGLSLDKIDVKNNKDIIEILETVKISTPTYASTAGEKLLVNPNMFNRFTSVPPRYSERKLPFVIERAFYDEDEYVINLPEGYKLETTMQDQKIESQFGIYTASLEILSDTQVKYKRSFEINKGKFTKEDYKTYRSFIRKVVKADKSSIVLNK